MFAFSSPQQKRSFNLFAIFFTFFIDNLAWSIVFPVFAPFFLDPENTLFSPEFSIASRTALLGVFLGVFHLAQFVSAPLIGEFSDKNGRRKAFLYTIFLTFVGCFISAFALQKKILWLLFLGRLISGFFSGNLSICLAAIADVSHKKNARLENFGYLAFFAGTAFIVGAYLGGKLSDPNISSYFFLSLPFWVGTVAVFLNYLFVLFFFEESFQKMGNVRFRFSQGFRNVQSALKEENIKRVYLIYFLFLLSWNVLLQFSPILAVRKFSFSTSNLGDFIAFLGLCWAFGSGILTKLLPRFFDIKTILFLSLLSFSFSSFVVIFLKETWMFVLLVGASVTISAVAWPLFTNLISSRVGASKQGKILGLSQSMQSLAMGMAPLSAAFSYASLHIPFGLGGCICAFALWLYVNSDF